MSFFTKATEAEERLLKMEMDISTNNVRQYTIERKLSDLSYRVAKSSIAVDEAIQFIREQFKSLEKERKEP